MARREKRVTIDEMINFVKENYCDIEAYPLPRAVGSLPPEIRLIRNKDLDELFKKAKEAHGKKFALFLKVNFVKNSTLLFWLDFDNWDFMYKCWKE